MARRSFRRCIKLLTPRPSSRSSSVNPSKTCKKKNSKETTLHRRLSHSGRECYKVNNMEACRNLQVLPYLAAFDVFWAGADVHGHRHDNLQPGLHGACPPQRHGRCPGQLHLLQTVELVLWPVWQAEASGAGEAIRVWVGRQMGDAVVVVRESRGEHCEQWKIK